MARKDLLKGLMEAPAPQPAPQPPEEKVDVARPRYSKGAIGAVSQSIADLKSRAIQEIDTGLIEWAGPRDRLIDVEEDVAELAESIRQYGQQVPVLLRPHPDQEGHYQVVFGRRRVAAMTRLGQPVKAMIRDLDRTEFVIAQGQENTARRDLSYIEKCNFARQLRDEDYDRKVICDALSVDKTQISRMLSVADRVPLGLIELIGPAPSVGRDRWHELGEVVAARGGDWTPALELMFDQGSDAAFVAVLDALKAANIRAKPPAPKQALQKRDLVAQSGARLAVVKEGTGKLTFEFTRSDQGAFADWLAEQLPQLHQNWQADHSASQDAAEQISEQFTTKGGTKGKA